MSEEWNWEQEIAEEKYPKLKASRLKEIALSERNTFSERMRAIDLLEQIGKVAIPELSDVASKAITYSERWTALDKLEHLSKVKQNPSFA